MCVVVCVTKPYVAGSVPHKVQCRRPIGCGELYAPKVQLIVRVDDVVYNIRNKCGLMLLRISAKLVHVFYF